MDTSIFLARLLGPSMLVIVAGLAVNRATYRALSREFLDSPALIYLAGLMTFVAGLAIVLTHNVWVANWPVLITIVGWLGVITGVARTVAPQRVAERGKTFAANHNFPYIAGGIWFLVGAVLCFFGYVR